MNLKQAKALAAWYGKNARSFPWREDPHPYKVWVAEIMSQQTVMAALLPYFARFMGRFPSVQDLATAPDEEVMKAWAGLGYYSRARNLHRAAKQLANGGWPRTLEGWLEVPGVGPYTAAAVTAQCFGGREPVWDGNVLRVMSRFLGRGDAYSAAFKLDAMAQLRAVLKNEGLAPSAFNQGLMELGATVCSPKNARCHACPISDGCVAFHERRVGELPPPKPRKDFIDVRVRSFVLVKGGRVFVVPRMRGQWFAGLWDFPSELGGVKAPVLCAPVSRAGAASAKPVRHSITHHKVLIEPVIISDAKTAKALTGGEGRWLTPEELAAGAVPLATTAKKVWRAVAGSFSAHTAPILLATSRNGQ